ncbi:cytochrome P450 [Dendrothele bispora CBS 962.96]|uniref:Cytochrome P450 n=1 Tax=Dendrothele bispora (strain CBS 962.96) TaxID=1314807 RepID=A0A4S8LWJ1_DENBC|nr:cytochrome P450 [Dendrothele bispora CBS 962.96]
MDSTSQYLDRALVHFASTSPALRAGLLIILTWILLDITRKLFRKSPYAHLPGPPRKSQLGYLPELHSEESLFDFHYPMTEKYGHVSRLRGGFYGLQRDALYVTDPLALNSILIRNQQNFPESIEFSGLFGVIHHGNSLASVWGEHHKKQRKMMNPVFTAAFVSKLTPMFYKIAYQSRDTLAKAVQNSSDGIVDVLDHLTRTALELISQGGLGHSFNSFDRNSKEFTEFHEALKTVLPMSGRIFFVLPYLESWRKIRPDWLRKFFSSAVYYLPWPSMRKFKWGCDTMHPVCKKLFIEKKQMLREGTIDHSAMGGRDLATLLMRANSQAEEEDRMSDEDVVANMSSIVLGGQETTSGALTRLLCLIVNDLDLQQRLRDEINEAVKKNGEDLPYSELNALPLLDGVCREALRLFSPVTFVWRDTTEDCVVPLQFPIQGPDGSEVKELLITKGTPVYIGLSASNRSRAIWGPDVGEMKPERWMGKGLLESTGNGVKMPGIFSNIMTFLGGGRACPGMKFALLEIKLVLSILIPHFVFRSVPEEIDWRMGITVVPYVKGKEIKGPSAPMKIQLVILYHFEAMFSHGSQDPLN